MTRKQGYELARRAALKSEFYRCKTGCVAIYRGRVLAEGFNSDKTSSLQARYNALRGFDSYKYKATCHAEMAVIQKIRYLDIDFSQVEVFVWRGEHSPKMARPCEGCAAALRDLGIKKVYYTGDDSLIREIFV